jgi:hypothetical protein
LVNIEFKILLSEKKKITHIKRNNFIEIKDLIACVCLLYIYKIIWYDRVAI